MAKKLQKQDGKTGKWKVRPFQYLLADMSFFLEEAKKHRDEFDNSSLSLNEMPKSKSFPREKTYARASLIVGLAALEAFVNQVSFEFAKRRMNELPEKWLNKKQKGRVEREEEFNWWPLVDKILFLPSLCLNNVARSPIEYWEIESDNFKQLNYTIKIRNEVIHGKPIEMRCRVTKDSTLYDDFPQNFFPSTRNSKKVSKDLQIFSHANALQASDSIVWAYEELQKHLETLLDPKFLIEQRIELDSGGFANIQRQSSV